MFERHADALAQVGANPNNGFGNVLSAIETLPAEKRDEIMADIEAVYAKNPELAMVNSDKGITNLRTQ